MALPKCHNCRRRRLRCDRSIPGCNKCAATGQECLGYGQLYRWTNSMASRGRMTGKKTFNKSYSDSYDGAELVAVPKKCWSSCDSVEPQRLYIPGTPLIDPIFQDLDCASRYYLNYFASRFCRDLVVHDSPLQGANPFRELIPLSGGHIFLRHIIIATSALHFSNVFRYASPTEKGLCQTAADALFDALKARHKAIKALQQALERRKQLEVGQDNSGENDALLATVVFFINFSLIDVGRDGWQAHMEAAGRLVESRCLSADTPQSISVGTPQSDCLIPSPLGDKGSDGALSLNAAASKMRYVLLPRSVSPSRPPQSTAVDCVISDFVAYYIWNSTLETLTFSTQQPGYHIPSIEIDPSSILPLLLRTEANSYHSCPARLLLLILRTSILARDILSNPSSLPTASQLDTCADILAEMHCFDTQAWANEIYARNLMAFGVVDKFEVHLRAHIATTYRTTACLYMLLIAPGLQSYMRRRAQSRAAEDEHLPTLLNTEDYAAMTLKLLSSVPAASPLFKYTTWPVFMTGVETALPERRAWVMERMQAMLDLCPWGMLTAAMETLTEIWQRRDAATATSEGGDSVVSGDAADTEQSPEMNLLVRLRGLKIDCLIV